MGDWILWQYLKYPFKLYVVLRCTFHLMMTGDDSFRLWKEYIQRKLPDKYLFMAIFLYQKFIKALTWCVLIPLCWKIYNNNIKTPE